MVSDWPLASRRRRVMMASAPAAAPTSSSSRTPSCALAEVHASDDAKEKFVNDFVAEWGKVMDLDPVRPRLIKASRPARAGLDVLAPVCLRC
jgi:hypothetical protein